MKRESEEKELVISFRFLGDEYSKMEPVKLKELQKGDYVLVKTFWGNSKTQKNQLVNAVCGEVVSMDDDFLILKVYKDSDDLENFSLRKLEMDKLKPVGCAEIFKENNYKKMYLDEAYMEELGFLSKLVGCILASINNENGEGAIVQPKYNQVTRFHVKDDLFEVRFSIVLTEYVRNGRKKFVNADKLEQLLLNTYPLDQLISAKSLKIEEID